MTDLLEAYDLALLVMGLAAFGVVGLPKLLSDRPLSYPIVFVVGGMALFALPFGIVQPDPVEYAATTEALTELGVITALMGAGLALNRPVGLRRWRTTWMLLGVTMPLTIGAVALLGWWVLGLTPAAAVLLGAVLAPTDPVLASDVQVPKPNVGDDEVRFALTSEAGLNDGLAFPFTLLAMLLAVGGTDSSGWLIEFLAVEVLYKIGAGLASGIVVGRLLAWAIFSRHSPIPETRDGVIALAATLIAYAGTEFIRGYGFVAVFVAALVIRAYQGEHEYHDQLHQFSDQIERLLSAVLLVLFGGAITAGLLGPLGWRETVVAFVIVLLVRPLAGWAGLIGVPVAKPERAAISFFGIRGVGSFYYLAYATNQVEFLQTDGLWAIVGLVVGISIVVHGVTASPVIRLIDRRAEAGAG